MLISNYVSFNIISCLFLFDPVQRARAEIQKYFRSVFGSNENLLSRLTDLYYDQNHKIFYFGISIKVGKDGIGILDELKICSKIFYKPRRFVHENPN